jgi:hypothetical protein
MDMHEMFQELMDNMPDDLKEDLRKMVYDRTDQLVSNPSTREATRSRMIAEGEVDALRGFEAACRMYDLNVQVVQALGNIKAMLSKFDEKDLSSYKLKDNLNLFKQVTMIMGIANDGMKAQVGDIIGEENENRDGDTSS